MATRRPSSDPSTDRQPTAVSPATGKVAAVSNGSASGIWARWSVRTTAHSAHAPPFTHPTTRAPSGRAAPIRGGTRDNAGEIHPGRHPSISRRSVVHSPRFKGTACTFTKAWLSAGRGSSTSRILDPPGAHRGRQRALARAFLLGVALAHSSRWNDADSGGRGAWKEESRRPRLRWRGTKRRRSCPRSAVPGSSCSPRSSRPPPVAKGPRAADGAPSGTTNGASGSTQGPATPPTGTHAGPNGIDACVLVNPEDATAVLGGSVEVVEDPFAEGVVRPRRTRATRARAITGRSRTTGRVWSASSCSRPDRSRRNNCKRRSRTDRSSVGDSTTARGKWIRRSS